MTHYYKKNNLPVCALKEPVENYPEIDKTGLVEITKKEFDELLPKHPAPTKEQERHEKFLSLKKELASYDYIGTKIAMGVATKEDYAKEIAYTEELRKQIRELIKEIEEEL